MNTTTKMEVRGRAIIVSGSQRLLVTEINSIASAVLGRCSEGFSTDYNNSLSPYRSAGRCTVVHARWCIDLLISLGNTVTYIKRCWKFLNSSEIHNTLFLHQKTEISKNSSIYRLNVNNLSIITFQRESLTDIKDDKLIVQLSFNNFFCVRLFIGKRSLPKNTLLIKLRALCSWIRNWRIFGSTLLRIPIKFRGWSLSAGIDALGKFFFSRVN